MADPIASFSGLSSGIQWRDLVDQIMHLEAARRYDPLVARQSALRAQSAAWTQFQGIAARFRDAARTLQQGTLFDIFTATAAKSATTGRELATVAAGAGAAPGSYALEVLATASAEKLGGAVVANATTALGVAGTFALNGRGVTVAATDTLTAVRDKINAANAGSGASGVSAALVSSNGGVRLVLSALSTGAAGVEATDGGSGVLAALGFTDGTVESNLGPDGAARTHRISSSTAALATVLGLPTITPTTIRVGGQSIAIDLAVDSLTTIAARIAAATGQVDAARVRSETTGTTTRYWLETDVTIEADPHAASAQVLAALGFTREGRSDVAQVIGGAHAFADALTGLPATHASLLTDLQANGQSLAITVGDTIQIGGTKGDGSAVSRSYTVTGTSTLADLLAAIGDDTSGFGAGTRPATVGLVGGRITLADGTAGDSALALSLSVTRAVGPSVTLGTFSTAHGTVGHDRVITSGTDALVRIDGQLVRRSTNTITDAIPGTTISALSAEPGTIAQITIARDVKAVSKGLQDFAAAYNAVRGWATANSAAGGPLAGNTSLRAMANTLTAQLLQPVIGVSGPWSSAALVGLQHDKNGTLSLDAAMFEAALSSDVDALRRLFAVTGTSTDSEVSFITAGDLAAPSAAGYDVVITQAATQATVLGASWTTYATTGDPDTVSLTDAATGITGSIQIADGDDIATVVQRLNSLFATQKMSLNAELTVDNRIQLTSTAFGTEGGFTVEFTPGAGGDGTAMLGIAAGPHAGLDVAGLIDGVIATGKGQMLTGGAGTPVDGLVVRYAGTTARAAGTVSLSLGVGGALARAAGALANDATGTAAVNATTNTTTADALDSRLADIRLRLDARREALIRQFVAMEAAIAKSLALGNALTAQLSALSPSPRR